MQGQAINIGSFSVKSVLLTNCLHLPIFADWLLQAASTEWRRMIVRLNGKEDYNTIDPHDRGDVEFMQVAGLTPSEATKIMNDPMWHRVVMLRDPAVRLLSAYLDKFVMHPHK